MADSLDNQSYYDEFSEWYESARHEGYHALLDELELRLAVPLAADREVLEAGCGTGLILRTLHKHAARAVGADLSRGMVSKAHARGLNVVQASVTALPFPDASFDLVCSFKVLAHVPAIEEALIELARVTRPGGALLLEFYNPRSLRYLTKRFRSGHISEATKESAVFTRWDSVRRIRDYLPPELHLEGVRGVRVFTPFAQVHRVPGLRWAFGALERWALQSPVSGFGGFLVAVLKKDA